MKRWQVWVGLLVVLIIAAAGLSTAYNWWLAEPVSEIGPAQKQHVARGPISVSVLAYGRAIAPDPVVINSTVAGRLREVLVREGDPVRTGQVVARLDAADLDAAVRSAQVALQTSEAQLARSRASASPEYVKILEAALAVARTRLLTAQATENGARASLAGARQGAPAEELAIAERRIEEAKNTLWGAQAQRDAICGRVNAGIGQAECDSAGAAVGRAEESVRISELQLQQLQAGPKAATIAAAQAQLDAATGQIKTAEAQVAQAEAELQNALAGPRREDVAIAEAQRAQAQFNLAEAERKRQGAEIVALADGTVIALGASVGQNVTASTPIVTVQALDHLTIETLVSELYIDRIRPGQRAHVLLEADPGRSWEGQVDAVGALPTLSAGLAHYAVTISLPPEALQRPGLSAEAEIMIDERPDALLVPRQALRLQGDDWIVHVLRDRPVAIPVVTGAQQGRWVEVIGDLAEGEELVTATTSLGTERGDYVWLPFGIMWRID